MSAANFTVAPLEELEPWAAEMLAEQEEAQATAEPEQQDPAASDVILFQVPALAVGDAKGLADIILAHPELYEQILATAAGFLGNDTVAKALDIVNAPQVQAEAPKEEETTPPEVVAQEAAEATPAGQPDASPEQVQQEAEAPASESQSAEPEPESGWVVRARAFNANHPDEVALFNHATGYACTVGGEVDPNAVANWQAANGVSPDGRVGKETADAAWELMPVEMPQAPQQLAEQGPPEA